MLKQQKPPITKADIWTWKTKSNFVDSIIITAV